MDFLTTPAAFVFVLGVIIFVHEFGHFLTAKAFGMRVFIFSFGFGRRLLGFKWGDTDCRLSLVPLGGYVKLEGEPEDLLSEDTSGLGDGRDFTSRPHWQRFLVYVAGPAMNVLLTIAVLAALYMIGYGEPASLSERPVIGSFESASPAEAAGLQPGDEILLIDGRPQPTWEVARYNIIIRPDAELRIRIRRGAKEKEVLVRSRSTPEERAGTIGVRPLIHVQAVTPGSPAQAAGLRVGDAILRFSRQEIRSPDDLPRAVESSAGTAAIVRLYRDGSILELPITPRNDGAGPRIGVQVGDRIVVRKYGPLDAVKAAGRRTWEMTRQIFEILGRLVTGKLSAKTMAGPLGIARQSGDAARQGSLSLFAFVAFLSLNVGILNLFPLAPLDGGHMAILLSEGILRRDFSLDVKNWIMNAGAAVLFLLIGLVLYSDLSKTSWFGRYLP